MSKVLERPDWARPIGTCMTKDELAIDAEDYARHVVESEGLNVDMADIDFEASARLTRSHGNCRSKDGEHFLVKVSWKAYENHGWDSIKDTIRHELAHVVQFDRDGYTNHDSRFAAIADELDAPVGADETAAPPKYILECVDCGASETRQRRSKIVKHPDDYHCGDCGGDIISYEYKDTDD